MIMFLMNQIYLLFRFVIFSAILKNNDDVMAM